MGQNLSEKIYAVPPGFVSADPERNRYVRKQGTSIDLPPRLNPEYGRDVADPKNGIDWIGVGADLGKIAIGTLIAGVPMTIPLAMGGAGLAGLDAFDELHEASQRQKR
jgi:hypothetical protein